MLRLPASPRSCGPFFHRRSDALLVRGSGKRPESVEELVGPRLMARLDKLDVLSRKVFAGKLPGERRSKKRGQSVEFEDYRPYVRGDDLRRIDWKIYARLERLFTKIFLEEEDLSLHVVVDASASMLAGTPMKGAFAQRLAMTLGYVGLVKRNRVAATVFGGRRLARFGERRGRQSVRALGQFLIEEAWPEDGAAGEKADFKNGMRSVALTRAGKGVTVVLSDFFIPGGYEDGLKLLAGARGFDTYCIQTLAPGEIDPAREPDEGLSGTRGRGVAGDLRLVDIETGQAAEVTVTSALVAAYRERLEAYCNGLGEYCRAREMAHLVAQTDMDVEVLAMETLRRRGLLK